MSDPGNQVAAQYGIKYKMADELVKLYKQFGVKVDEYNGGDSWTLPMPSRLIIGRNGTSPTLKSIRITR